MYLNGVAMLSHATEPEWYQENLYPLVNFAIGGGWPYSALNGTGPLYMIIEYVKVWSENTFD
jgi:hypothetical protein